MTKQPRPENLPFTPSDFAKLDRDPRTSAAEIYDYAPKTAEALITLYCQEYADDAPPGRHVETAAVRDDVL